MTDQPTESGTLDPDGPATSRKTTKEASEYLEAMIEAGRGRPLSDFVSDGRGPKDDEEDQP